MVQAKKPSSRLLTTRRRRVQLILPILNQVYPDARCALYFSNPLELLVATILSAQCTDERVNLVCRELFQKYRSAGDYASASQAALENDIKSINFFRNKARAIRAMTQQLIDEHHGQVPPEMAALVKLPGVGRKTANVVLGNAFNQNVGVVVDTHVLRVANRLELTGHPSDAVKIEQDLIRVVPQEQWTHFSHLLILHGRAICTARNPKCETCPIFVHCPTGPRILEQRRRVADQKARTKAKSKVTTKAKAGAKTKSKAKSATIRRAARA